MELRTDCSLTFCNLEKWHTVGNSLQSTWTRDQKEESQDILKKKWQRKIKFDFNKQRTKKNLFQGEQRKNPKQTSQSEPVILAEFLKCIGQEVFSTHDQLT